MKPSLTPLLAPNSIAVLGASDDPLKPGGRVIDYMLRYGYQGQIFPVSKNRDTVQGLTAYRSLEDLPQAPDLVVIALPEALIEASLKTAGKMGTRSAIIFASGYAEVGDEGRAAQARIGALAQELGMRIVGPNTQGVANFATGATAHFGTIIDQITSPPSPIGIVSQSGAGSQITYARLHELGLGARYLVATGNEADVDIADVVQAYAADEHLKLILVYAEALKSPARLAEAALLARQRNIPIIMVKAGRTESGQNTAASHTGALASEDRMVDAFLEKYGILRAADFEELAALSQLFLEQRGRRGRRMVAISNSGASCVLSADAAEDNHLALSTFDADLKQSLGEVLPSFITPGNPIDLTTATLKNPQLLEQVLERLANSNNVDLLMACFPIGGRGYDFGRYASELRAFSDASGIPVAVSTNQDWAAATFREHNLPVFSSERRAVAALAALATYHDRQALATTQPLSPPAATPEGQAPQIRNELDSMDLLAAAGLPVVRSQICDSPEAALALWQAWGQKKVVLKGVSDSIAHKSDHGLVRLGLNDATRLQQAAIDVLAILEKLGETSPRILLAEMVSADFELMAGAHHDPQFGPVVAVGHGGVLVETLNDIQFIPAPLTRDEAVRAIERLQIARAFTATRGLPAVNIAPLADALVKLGALITDSSQNIASLDINPILIRRGDHAPVIVDALVMQSLVEEPA